MLEHIVDVARTSGMPRLNRTWDCFKPAIPLYRRHGFVECPPFDAWRPDQNSIFLTRDL